MHGLNICSPTSSQLPEHGLHQQQHDIPPQLQLSQLLWPIHRNGNHQCAHAMKHAPKYSYLSIDGKEAVYNRQNNHAIIHIRNTFFFLYLALFPSFFLAFFPSFYLSLFLPFSYFPISFPLSFFLSFFFLSISLSLSSS